MNKLKQYVQFDKWKCLIGIALAIISFIIFALFKSWNSAVFYALLFLSFGAVRLSMPKTWISYILFALWALFAIWLTKIAPSYTLNLVNHTYESKSIFYLNYLCILLIITAVFALSTNPKLAINLGTFILIALAVTNGFVYQFRGREFGFMDILSIQTAINVAGKYHAEITLNMVYVVVRWVAVLFIGFTLPKLPKLPRILPRAIGAAVVILVVLLLKPMTAKFHTETWACEGTRLNGFYINVYMGIRDSSIEKPKNYSLANIEQLAQKYLVTDPIPEDKELPNVVIIMNESFSDLRIFGDLNTNAEITPFIDSLSENTVRGYAVSSVFGGNTANSEFEVLTGHSIAFFPEFSVPYQQYINHKTHTLVNILESYGYQSLGTHPYWNNGWSRNTIYPLFGFDQVTFSEAYARNYPVRYYTSDRDMFDYVLANLDYKEGDKPLFLFGVTMQNHGGYDYKGKDFVEHIQLMGRDEEYPLATQYLNLIHETDMAVEYFLHELELREEPTIVLFFGDHLPQLESGFFDEIYGSNFKTLPEQQLHYTVPFFIWANFDIPEKDIPCTSLNYLSLHLFNAAGLPLSPYQRFLADIEQTIPAMNPRGFYSKEKESFIEYDEASSEEKDALAQYHALVYNQLFDRKHKNTIFFP
ncbi:MAG: hypothetical protein E7403_04130 [Ruminococcaceae bacterium]|nr:hypothetical protein [Oscillospiraceae bacterium]